VTGLRGEAVIVTGATGGFGRAIARRLADVGANLVLTARCRDQLADLAHTDLRGTTVRTVPADLADAAAMEPVAAEALRCFGRVDALVNNAAVFGPLGPAWDVEGRDWWHVMEVNLRGTLSGCRAVLPHMTTRNRGRIVNIASNAGHTRWPLASAYSVSKAAVTKLTENLAVEARRHGVSVFAYHPGLLDIGLTETRGTLVDRYGHAATPVVTWLDQQILDGATTPLTVAVDGVLTLLDGSADHLSGRYVTADLLEGRFR
jgi:NAD(P)-dependent dehydrogenase (short-subunit alcohol dehydrogenase family)